MDFSKEMKQKVISYKLARKVLKYLLTGILGLSKSI